MKIVRVVLLLALPAALSAQGPATPPVNVAPSARVVASFTASNGLLHSVNDEALPSSASSMEAWHTWGAPADTVTIAYEWPFALTLNSLEVAWWYDQTEPARAGVQVPRHAGVQYWTGAEWEDVTNLRDADGRAASSIGVAGSGTTRSNAVFNRVTFAPVSTSRIRLVIAQTREARGTGVGISEWRVFTEDPASMVFSRVAFIDPQWTTRNVMLPTDAAGYTITWTSSRPNVISDAGRVQRDGDDRDVVLTATARRAGAATITRQYPFRVLRAGAAGRTLELDLARRGIEISATLYGLFYEDICHALDGGLNANLIDNGSFQQYNWPTALPERVSNRGPNDDRYSLDPREIYSWTALGRGGATGTATIVDAKPMNANNGYSVEIEVTAAGSGAQAGFGIGANGYAQQATNVRQPSLPINAGVGYDLSLYLQGGSYRGTVRVALENATGELNSNVLEFRGLSAAWRQFAGRLTALRTEDSRMLITGDSVGSFYIDYVVLRPEPAQLWRNGAAGGLRPDMAQAMANIAPRFLRFPGGCATEGKSQDRLYRWKDTVGPPETRRQMPNYWGYWSSNEIGFYEYFLLAEQLGAEPLPVIGLGMTCPFHRGPNYYEAPIGSPECPECHDEYMRTYVQDALDLIEFANGDVSTKWGRLRAEMGHPEPFNLKYISLGNENWGESFWQRFDLMFNAVRKAYPAINIVSTAGPYASGRQLNENYQQIDAKYEHTIVDEHYYMGSPWFLNNTQRYDPASARGSEGRTYDRSRPTRVFVGEYADAGSGNHFMSALYEAAFTTALERNSDMVVMASYAPLFCKQGMTNWASNLIWFDNRGLWRTPNYYYQWIFANHVGNRALPNRFYTHDDANAQSDVFTAASVDTVSGTVYVKIVNPDAQPKDFRIALRNDGVPRVASYVHIRSDRLLARNQGTPDYNEQVRPQTVELGNVRDALVFVVPGYSIGALVLRP